MKYSIKWLALILVVSTMVVCFTGCSGISPSFDAALFVKGNMDSQYLGVVSDDYMEILSDSKESVLESYEEGLILEAEYFYNYFEIVEESIPPEMKTEVVEMYRAIYAKSKYEVGEATKSGDSYLVSVTIHPIDIITKITDEDSEAFMEGWSAKFDSGEFDDLSDDELETEWARGVIDLAKARLGNIGYLDPQTISVQVVLQPSGDNEYYVISDNDMSRIDVLMIQY